jgi:Concanavalin A-like lectin/glucanases superfamily
MFWIRSNGVRDTNGNPATVFDRQNGNGLVLFQNADGSLEMKTSQGAQDLTTGNVSDDKWHHVAVTFDQSAGGQSAFYVDGQTVGSGANVNPWSWQLGQEIELGLSHNTNSWQAFNGLLDDVRVYSRVLIDTEVTSAFGGALVDTNALTMRLNFDSPPTSGVTLKWLTPDAILQSADNVGGPYTDVPGAVSPHPTVQRSTTKFYRYSGHAGKIVVSNPYLM